MKYLGSTIERLDRLRPAVLAELHPQLRDLVEAVLDELDGRFAPYCGFRDEKGQERARKAGNSQARYGESPHNFMPALACDVVLDPRMVPLRASLSDENYPDLWDDETPEAVEAWETLELVARKHGLERVNVGGKRDRPHLQLAGWRGYIPI